MKVKIENLGDVGVRVISDHDNINDTVLEAGATDVFESRDEGVIELREFDDGAEAEPREQA
ncbi:hypothetical protein [Caballeronia sp. NCTM5]|uniref:hypothetical protein n=1 Tax=Caballeronia sp. NCTM5 TaxID=2921755 RepID=UPI00202865FF|nr:hypothetical protein [Caballeronia sp. NCTM5]